MVRGIIGVTDSAGVVNDANQLWFATVSCHEGETTTRHSIQL